MLAALFRLWRRVIRMPMDTLERQRAIGELEREIIKLSNDDCFLAEYAHHPEYMKKAAHIKRLIESMRERAGEIESGAD